MGKQMEGDNKQRRACVEREADSRPSEYGMSTEGSKQSRAASDAAHMDKLAELQKA